MGLFDWLKRTFLGDSQVRSKDPPWLKYPDPGKPNPTPSTTDSRPISRPQSTTLTSLAAEQFAPIERSDVQDQAKSLGRPSWTNPWFGRRDLIPPTEDPRTLMIDQAMVGEGLVSAEELAEIHQIGDEMDEIRPDVAHASLRADAAVRQSVEQRKAIKAQKKQEAAQRKSQHDDAVGRRRATDIVFLGRGVSRGLADRRANVELLQQNNLPLLATPADVAKALELTIGELRWLAFHSEASQRTHYLYFDVPKKNGSLRRLATPHARLKKAQYWIFEQIIRQLSVHSAAHGFVPGRSTVTNATPHVGQQVLINTDLQDFFPSIGFRRVAGLFRSVGYSPAAATILALLCTESPRQEVTYNGRRFFVAVGERALPQGACTSPGISNLIARRLDSRLTGISEKLGWNYTRYADDCSFSASGESADKVGYLLARIRHICSDEGFRIHAKKTRVQRPNTSQRVTGIVVNEKTNVARPTIRRLRAILHRAQTEGLAAQNRHDHPNFTAWVDGMIAYVQMVNPQQGEKLRRAFQTL